MSAEQPSGWRKWLWPLRSRKVQVAVATVIVAYAARAGWVLSEDTVVTVLGVGVALILGIAHEDAGRAGGTG
jgi:ribosomal protein S12